MLIVVYVAALLGALCGLGIYSEMRRRRFGRGCRTGFSAVEIAAASTPTTRTWTVRVARNAGS